MGANQATCSAAQRAFALARLAGATLSKALPKAAAAIALLCPIKAETFPWFRTTTQHAAPALAVAITAWIGRPLLAALPKFSIRRAAPPETATTVLPMAPSIALHTNER